MKPIRHYQSWTPQEDAELRRLHATTMPTREIAKRLGRTTDAVCRRASNLKLGFKPQACFKLLTKEQQTWLRRNYPHYSTKTCAVYLGLTPFQCRSYANRMGIKKSPEYVSEIKHYASTCTLQYKSAHDK